MPPLSSNATQLNQNQQQQPGGGRLNMKRKSSKPILNWLQRKLAGARRVSDGGRRSSESKGAERMRAAGASKSPNATVSQAGSKSLGVRITDENMYATARGRSDVHRSLSNEISLNSIGSCSDDDLNSTRRSSGNVGSLWSPSNQLEADEDASIRPLPPTSPPSPSPSRSSSSYLSDPKTFKSMSISTKPTTVLSMDLTTNGMAHIAQAPPTPTSVHNMHMSGALSRIAHARTSSTGPGTSITFSALPPSPQSSRPPSLNPTPLRTGALQAPQHTTHHPRNNPRPSSPPLDNASVLTLASSAFGVSPTAHRIVYRGADDSTSHLGLGPAGDSLSVIMRSGVDDSVLAVDDREASVRALRPRSSRRGSWESEASRWSAGMGSVLGNLAGGRSVRTAPSYRTGGQGATDDVDEDGDRRSMSLAEDDDGVMMGREEGDMMMTTTEDGEDGMSSRDYVRSPTSSLGIDAVLEESSDIQSALTKPEESSDAAAHELVASMMERKRDGDHEEASTPATTTFELAEPETTPKKERKVGLLDDTNEVIDEEQHTTEASPSSAADVSEEVKAADLFSPS